MSIEDRRTELLGAVEYLLVCHREWQESAEDRLREDSELFEALNLVMALFADGDIPGNCRRLAGRVAEMDDPWQQWRTACAANPLRAPAQPGESFWRAIELLPGLVAEVYAPKIVRHASVAELVAQKVTPVQICRIWKLLRPDGSPDFEKLEEEKAMPGTHTAVNPLAARATAEAEALRTRVATAREKLAAKQAAKRQAPPDSLEAIVAQGVSVKQIARMFHKPVAWVVEECQRLGIQPPVAEYAPLTAAKAPQEPEWNEEGQRMLDAMPVRGGGAGAADEDLSAFYDEPSPAAASVPAASPPAPATMSGGRRRSPSKARR